MVDDTLNIEGI